MITLKPPITIGGSKTWDEMVYIMKALKIAGIVLGLLLVLLTGGLVVGKVALNATYLDGYDPKAPLDAKETDVQERPGYIRTELYYNGCKNDRVPTLLATPKEGKGPWPCIIFLHGIGQRKTFLDEIAEPFVKAGFAFVSFDQLMCGERHPKTSSNFDLAKAFIQRPAYTINDTRRLIDYLQTRSDIVPTRIYLTGASYGAITGSTVVAFDKRIPAVSLCYGGGHIADMLEARAVSGEIRKYAPMWFAKSLAWYLLSAADPVNYIAQISPRPIFFQNGTNDCLISTAAAKALHDAAKDPKVVKYYEGDHIGMDRNTVMQVLNDILTFFQEQDAKVTGVPAPVKASV